jgi:hypothetical protein
LEIASASASMIARAAMVERVERFCSPTRTLSRTAGASVDVSTRMSLLSSTRSLEAIAVR